MKILQIIFAVLMLAFFGINDVYTQSDSKKDKVKEKKSVSKSLEVKANLMVLEADGKFADIKPEDLKIFEDGVEQKVTRFVKKENALNVGLVIDNTASMRPQLKNIAAAGATFINNLRPQDEFFLVHFVSSDNIEILQDWTSDKKLMNVALSDMFIEGGASAVVDGVYLAANKIIEREKTDKNKRNALILISDGEDRASFYKPVFLFDLLKQSEVQIYTIGLTGDLGNDALKENVTRFINQLAFKTGGAAFFVENKNKKDFEAALLASLKAILTELNSQYIIGYSSTNQRRDDSTKKLSVQVADSSKGEKRQAFIREKFTVPE